MSTAWGLLYEVDEAGNTKTYHYDYRGSTVAITDDAGNVTDRIGYSAYGAIIYRTGNTDTPFLFNGRYGVQTDPNGLLYMRARYYNPYLCRFINPDPAGFSGGFNFYVYADGNPVSLLDPFGLGAVGESQVWSWLENATDAMGEAVGTAAKYAALALVAVLDVLGQGLNGELGGGGGAEPSPQGAFNLLMMLAPELRTATLETRSAIAAKGTETFYRTMSQANYDTLMATGKLPATSETFISPSLEYASKYNGVTVQFNVQAGTTDSLLGMGVRNVGLNGGAYRNLPLVQSGWGSSSAFFKLEGNLVNVGLGRGSALNTFNNNIVNFNLVPKP